MNQKYEVCVTTKSYWFDSDEGWEGATKDAVRDYILNGMNVNVFPVFACSDSDAEFCNSGVFLNSEDELEEAVMGSGWVELGDLVEYPNPLRPEWQFNVTLRYCQEWRVKVQAESPELAENLVEKNLAKCFQLEEMDVAGLFEIEVVQIDSVTRMI